MPTLKDYNWISNYTDAENALGDNQQTTIGNNTTLINKGDIIAVKLHHTNVIKFHRNGDIELNTGGHKTSTTKDRLNRYTPSTIHVYQQDHAWYVDIETGDGTQTREFEDGMKV